MGNEDSISKQYSKTVEMNLIIAFFFVPLISANPLTRLGKNEPPIINIPLVTFNGDTSTTFKFHELNDPVMGGVSSGTWKVDNDKEFGIFNGTVRNVPALHAPGFIAAYSIGKFNDASAAIHGDLVLHVRSSTPDYTGFRVSFSSKTLSAEYSCAGGGTWPFSNGCFKAQFNVPSGNEFVDVRIPFSSFSDHWNPATGDQIVKCSDENPNVCPTESNLQHLRWLEIWAEGAGGDIHLEIKSVSANLNIPSSYVVVPSMDSDILLVTFDGSPSTTFKFRQYNDPVMGGISSGTWTVNEKDKYGIEDGTVRDVPSLHAPGFIKASAQGRFNDVSTALRGYLILKVRSTQPQYEGYRISFGSHFNSFKDYKSRFNVIPGDEFSEILIPFDEFSSEWDPATGDPTVTCADDPGVCPTEEDLSSIKRIEIWAEGAKGDANLEIQSIGAGVRNYGGGKSNNLEFSINSGNDDVLSGFTKELGMESVRINAQSLSNISDEFNICMGTIQNNLLYGMDRRTTSDYLPVQVDDNETLPEAVCCDSRMIPFAEPQFTYSAPDIRLFRRMDHTGITTFYDSVCGVPLFQAPIGRSFEEFEEDTREHGWPSFREEEVIKEFVVTDKSQEYVFSICGTHLGSYLPDEKGDRWCIDLACISGEEMYTPNIEIL